MYCLLIKLSTSCTAHCTYCHVLVPPVQVVSTVFLPITFLAGVYGTNFDYLPELHWWGRAGVVVRMMA